MTSLDLNIVCFFLYLGHLAVEAFVPASAQRSGHASTCTALNWSEGKNAAPAVLCEVENVPILEPIPEG
jgi:hypothetical protein